MMWVSHSLHQAFPKATELVVSSHVANNLSHEVQKQSGEILRVLWSSKSSGWAVLGTKAYTVKGAEENTGHVQFNQKGLLDTAHKAADDNNQLQTMMHSHDESQWHGFELSAQDKVTIENMRTSAPYIRTHVLAFRQKDGTTSYKAFDTHAQEIPMYVEGQRSNTRKNVLHVLGDNKFRNYEENKYNKAA